jgi:hypothetical protein
MGCLWNSVENGIFHAAESTVHNIWVRNSCKTDDFLKKRSSAFTCEHNTPQFYLISTEKKLIFFPIFQRWTARHFSGLFIRDIAGKA